jgi:hypothetical protein
MLANSAPSWPMSTICMIFANCPLAAITISSGSLFEGREGTTGHGMSRKPSDSGNGSGSLHSTKFLHHSIAKIGRNLARPAEIAETVPCSETQVCGCLWSSHRTCRQVLEDLEDVARVYVLCPVKLVDHRVQDVV